MRRRERVVPVDYGGVEAGGGPSFHDGFADFGQGDLAFVVAGPALVFVVEGVGGDDDGAGF